MHEIRIALGAHPSFIFRSPNVSHRIGRPLAFTYYPDFQSQSAPSHPPFSHK